MTYQFSFSLYATVPRNADKCSLTVSLLSRGVATWRKIDLTVNYGVMKWLLIVYWEVWIEAWVGCNKQSVLGWWWVSFVFIWDNFLQWFSGVVVTEGCCHGLVQGMIWIFSLVGLFADKKCGHEGYCYCCLGTSVSCNLIMLTALFRNCLPVCAVARQSDIFKTISTS